MMWVYFAFVMVGVFDCLFFYLLLCSIWLYLCLFCYGLDDCGLLAWFS